MKWVAYYEKSWYLLNLKIVVTGNFFKPYPIQILLYTNLRLYESIEQYQVENMMNWKKMELRKEDSEIMKKDISTQMYLVHFS